MAKHPHRLALVNKKTWKCTLPGCSFFVHSGLAHLLIGKTAQCDCGELYNVDERSLQDEIPTCLDCRGGHSSNCGIYEGKDCTCKLR